MRFAVSPKERRLWDLVRALDREEQPAAETWRLVGAAAERLDLTRPSYGHVRRLVCLARVLARVQEERRRVLGDAATRLVAGGVPNVPRLLDTLSELREQEELVFQEHKPP